MIFKEANWDKIWSKTDFKPHSLSDWEADIFINIYALLKNSPNSYILSAGCGRGLIDYWLINCLGYRVVLLDYSSECIQNLKKIFKKTDKNKYQICRASILNIPYQDNTFDLVWNEGVLEHFSVDDFERALKEMIRVSKKYILVDVPYSKSKPYMMAKKYLEENNLWPWGYEKPRISLIDDFKKFGVKVIKETPIGSTQTNFNYLNMIPLKDREKIIKELTEEDFKVFPHLMIIGEKNE